MDAKLSQGNFVGTVKLTNKSNIIPTNRRFPIQQGTSPAAMFEMIDFSAFCSSQHEVGILPSGKGPLGVVKSRSRFKAKRRLRALCRLSLPRRTVGCCLTTLGGGFTMIRDFPLYLEGTAGYGWYELSFFVSGGQVERPVRQRASRR